MKKGDLVSFNVVCDDSDYASNCFGVEAQNDWFDIQVYTDTVFGEIIKSNTIQVIRNTDGLKMDIFFKIKNGIINNEVNSLLDKKQIYDLNLCDIFEGSNLKTLKDFKEIKKINFIKLSSVRDWSKHDNYIYLDRIYMNGKIYLQESEVSNG